MTTENIDASAEIKLTSDESGHILYSISWFDMVREIVGVSDDNRMNDELSENSGIVELAVCRAKDPRKLVVRERRGLRKSSELPPMTEERSPPGPSKLSCRSRRDGDSAPEVRP